MGVQNRHLKPKVGGYFSGGGGGGGTSPATASCTPLMAAPLPSSSTPIGMCMGSSNVASYLRRSSGNGLLLDNEPPPPPTTTNSSAALVHFVDDSDFGLRRVSGGGGASGNGGILRNSSVTSQHHGNNKSSPLSAAQTPPPLTTVSSSATASRNSPSPPLPSPPPPETIANVCIDPTGIVDDGCIDDSPTAELLPTTDRGGGTEKNSSSIWLTVNSEEVWLWINQSTSSSFDLNDKSNATCSREDKFKLFCRRFQPVWRQNPIVTWDCCTVSHWPFLAIESPCSSFLSSINNS